MQAALKIVDRIPGQGHRDGPELTLASERITAAELIRRRVEAEVEIFNASADDVFRGLIQPTDSERVLNGFRPKKRRKLNAEDQVKAALDAFARNGFVLFFDDQQVDDPEEMLIVTPTSQATFIILVPLVGG